MEPNHFKSVDGFGTRLLASLSKETMLAISNYKGLVLEHCKKYKLTPPFVFCSSTGPAHQMIWSALTEWNKVTYRAEGTSKANVEQAVYKEIYNVMGTSGGGAPPLASDFAKLVVEATDDALSTLAAPYMTSADVRVVLLMRASWPQASYAAWIQENWNKIMHALNGNLVLEPLTPWYARGTMNSTHLSVGAFSYLMLAAIAGGPMKPIITFGGFGGYAMMHECDTPYNTTLGYNNLCAFWSGSYEGHGSSAGSNHGVQFNANLFNEGKGTDIMALSVINIDGPFTYDVRAWQNVWSPARNLCISGCVSQILTPPTLEWGVYPANVTVVTPYVGGYDEYLASNRNSEMHALNGNQMRPMHIRPLSKEEHAVHIRGRPTRKLDRKSKFDRQLQRCGLNFGCREFIKQMADPYHDTGINIVGMPTAGTDRSVRIVNPATYEISKPSSIPEGHSWDCHIVASNVLINMPHADIKNGDAFTDLPDGKYCVGAEYTWTPATGRMRCEFNVVAGEFVGVAPFPMGLQVFVNESNKNTMFIEGDTNPASTSTWSSYQIPLPTDLVAGSHRVVGYGFEVQNASPMLDKPGSVYTYRVPYESTVEAVNGGAIANSSFNFPNACYVQGTPANVTGVVATGICKQWDAKDGVYVVARPIDLPVLHRPSMHVPITRPLNIEMNEDGPGGIVVAGMVCFQKSGSDITILACPTSVHAWDLSGAYFTGLDDATKLTLAGVQFVEMIPNAAAHNQAVFARMATLPMAPSPNLHRAYNSVMKSLPPGVPFNFNGLGKWWDMVCDAAMLLSPAADAVLPGSGQVVRSAVSVAKAAKPVAQKIKRAIKNAKHEEKKLEKKVVAAKHTAVKK